MLSVSPVPERVYPRACGGTAVRVPVPAVLPGLSPRVRGNPYIGIDNDPKMGSIPARAGEPMYSMASCSEVRVYPRACGGTGAVRLLPVAPSGLSPRVRGNQGRLPAVEQDSRSIPARAGEPQPVARQGGLDQVYPRACGGTHSIGRSTGNVAGLSPRVRGNRASRVDPGPVAGSIPARAGEPRWGGTVVRQIRVYPRACGGTRTEQYCAIVAYGLSPRVRGNQLARRHEHV